MDAQETSFYSTVLIVSGVLGFIIILFIISIIRAQRRSVKLYRESILTEINTLERERTRIAADLHDEVGPILSAIKFRINSLEISDEESRQELQRTNEHLDALIKRMREISFDLMPNSLTRKGFSPAIKEFIEYCSLRNKIHIDFIASDNVKLNEKQAVNLYRIVQEVTHNSIKHSRATELKIELRKEKKCLILATHDNGVGFSYEAGAKESQGLGLRNLSRRTEIMGGKLYVESTKEKGTTYIFEIPIANEYNTD